MVTLILNDGIVDYLNSCYRSLILCDSAYITYHFSKMKRCYNHSEICLLNIIALVIKAFHLTLDRRAYDISGDIDAYLSSFDRQFEILSLPMIMIVSCTLSHKCVGKNIKECDPQIPMFSESSQ